MTTTPADNALNDTAYSLLREAQALLEHHYRGQRGLDLTRNKLLTRMKEFLK